MVSMHMVRIAVTWMKKNPTVPFGLQHFQVGETGAACHTFQFFCKMTNLIANFSWLPIQESLSTKCTQEILTSKGLAWWVLYRLQVRHLYNKRGPLSFSNCIFVSFASIHKFKRQNGTGILKKEQYITFLKNICKLHS